MKYSVGDYVNGLSIRIAIKPEGGESFQLVHGNAVGFGSSVDRTKVKPVGQKYSGYTPGIINYDDGSMELGMKDLENWIAQFEALATPDFSAEDLWNLHSFEVTITIRSRPGAEVVTKVLNDCTIINRANSFTFNATENLATSISFRVLSISG